MGMKLNKSDFKVMSFLAYKNIFKSKVTFAVIILVLAMSFLSVTFFASIIDGLGYEFEEKMISGSTGHLMVEPGDDETYITGSKELARDINRIPGVVGTARRLQTTSVAEHEDINLGTQTIFIEPAYEKSVSNYHLSIVEGSYLTDNSDKEVLIGANLVESYADEDDTRKRLDVEVGDELSLSFRNGVVKKYEVIGVYETGFRFVDEQLILDYDQYFTIFPGVSNAADKILVRLPDRESTAFYKNKIKYDLGVSEQVNPWQTKMGTIKQFVGSLQITNRITGVVGLLIAFATIYIIIFINVTSKRSQIGVLKAIGIKKEIILGSYIIQSLSYGVIGVAIGNVIMQLLLWFMSMYPLEVPIGEVVPILTNQRIISTSITIAMASVIAGYFPSNRAAKENILDAIFGR
ncbi:protein of unknown function DUF214 [Methanohalobium evestigatum Z-7303]|uniref:Uncharacterized protein n=2 Tax=Methanohalobium evestigatum TaxID=2322 RepID=D7E6V6_METEZ|nr:protein of unknown function DUF214 [Methanohalobium evestigatum Z-7303]